MQTWSMCHTFLTKIKSSEKERRNVVFIERDKKTGSECMINGQRLVAFLVKPTFWRCLSVLIDKSYLLFYTTCSFYRFFPLYFTQTKSLIRISKLLPSLSSATLDLDSARHLLCNLASVTVYTFQNNWFLLYFLPLWRKKSAWCFF